MAIGDASKKAGYGVVPDTGEEGRVRWGSREINRTRDFIAALAARVPANKTAARNAAGIRSGTAAPSGGENGDIYFRII